LPVASQSGLTYAQKYCCGAENKEARKCPCYKTKSFCKCLIYDGFMKLLDLGAV
jgi:hypothetical protein